VVVPHVTVTAPSFSFCSSQQAQVQLHRRSRSVQLPHETRVNITSLARLTTPNARWPPRPCMHAMSVRKEKVGPTPRTEPPKQLVTSPRIARRDTVISGSLATYCHFYFRFSCHLPWSPGRARASSEAYHVDLACAQPLNGSIPRNSGSRVLMSLHRDH
jgi:hypothetical protein